MKIKYIFLIIAIASFAGISIIHLVNHKTKNNKIKILSQNMHELPKAEFATEFADWEFLKTRDPETNSIPENIKGRELAFASTIPSKENQYKSNFLLGSKTLIQTQPWTNRGPSNIAGRILAIAFDNQNENIMLAGSASGGLWRSTDKGLSWVKATPPNVIQSVTCMAQDKRTGKTNTWYYGTGELLSTTDRKVNTLPRTIGIGDGIFKSTDDGLTWIQLPSTKTSSPGQLSNSFQGIWNIVTDYNNQNADIVYAACYGGILRSSDGGTSWTNVLGDINNKSFSTDIVITSKGVLYAALSTFTVNGSKPQKTGIYRSNDGMIWTNITPTNFPTSYRTIKLALAPSNEKVLYVLTEKAGTNSIQEFYSPSAYTFWKFTYNDMAGTGTWLNRTSYMPGKGTNYTSYLDLNTLGGYAMKVKVKPDDENVVYIGGTSLYVSRNGYTTDTSYVSIGGYPYGFTREELHPDMHAIEFLPSNPNRVYIGNDGGIQLTDSSLAGNIIWLNVNNALLTTQFYSVSINHKINGDQAIFGGLQ
ncbi:MAG: sialidase family protein, partial [FCB group bacterium]